MINKLPIDIQIKIFKNYFSNNVLDKINSKCFYHFKLGKDRSKIRCNLNTIDSAFCLACWTHFYHI